MKIDKFTVMVVVQIDILDFQPALTAGNQYWYDKKNREFYGFIDVINHFDLFSFALLVKPWPIDIPINTELLI